MRLIDGDELVKKILMEYRTKGVQYIKSNYMRYLYNAPTVDAEPVIHARWIENLFEGIIKCSNCREEWSIINNCCETFDRCPHCGAKMDLPDECQI